MATYAISFNLDYNSTYSDRYQSLMEAIRRCPKVWEETTSFALVESAETLEELERRLFLSKYSSATDLLLVIKVSYDDAIARGPIKDKDKLRALLPGITIN